MAKLTMEHTARSGWFPLDLGFGKAFDTINANENDLGDAHIEQAYVSLKPPSAKRFPGGRRKVCHLRRRRSD